MPRHSTIVAYLALFTALGGTSYAATTLDRNSVGTAQIRNGSVKPADLAKGARPMTAGRVSALVEETMTAPEVLTALSAAVEGDAGPQGPKGDAVPGPQGEQGSTGAQGQRGTALGSAHVAPYKAAMTTQGDIRVTKADGGLSHCVGASGPSTAPYVMLDADDPQHSLDDRAYVSKVDSNNPNGCAGYDFRIVTVNEAGDPDWRAFYVTLN